MAIHGHIPQDETRPPIRATSELRSIAKLELLSSAVRLKGRMTCSEVDQNHWNWWQRTNQQVDFNQEQFDKFGTEL